MSTYETQQPSALYFVGAVLLHGVFAALLWLATQHRSTPTWVTPLAIKAVVVDQAVLRRLEREQIAAKEKEQALAAQREQRRLEVKRQEAAQQAQLEAQRQAEAARKAALKEAEHQKKLQAQALEQKRREQIERERRVAQEAQEQAMREAELKTQLAAEENRHNAERAGLQSQYAALIEQRVYRYWNKPATAKPGLECEVKVVQAVGGVVLSVQLGRCNGDQAVRQSIEVAVYRASPLPAPPDPSLFTRNLILLFKPSE